MRLFGSAQQSRSFRLHVDVFFLNQLVEPLIVLVLSSGRTDLEGCCWWGRGALLTRGVCKTRQSCAPKF